MTKNLKKTHILIIFHSDSDIQTLELCSATISSKQRLIQYEKHGNNMVKVIGT